MADIENQIESNEDLQLIVIHNGTRRYHFLYLWYVMSGLCASLLVLYFVFIIYSIISLCKTSYYHQKQLCEYSDIWVFNIVSLIVAPSLSNNIIKSCYTKDKRFLLKNCLIYVIIIIWGTHECFIVRCISKLYDTLLYDILQINIMYGILLMFASGIVTAFS